MEKYKPPFPYFGGKSAVAHIVWERFGDVKNYVEPFFGSGAVLFLRPGGPGAIETVNDADGLVANFWRSMQRDSDSVAEHANWPVNEADLHARHCWLVGQRERITERLMGDPDFYDAKAAGWWVWGISCWIGSGWCSGNGSWWPVDGRLTKTGQGVNRKLPHLGSAGQGVNRQLPHLGNAGQGEWLKEYLGDFAKRLARVRVCCGDWTRVCTPAVTFRHGITGVFVDPPYADTANRTDGCYAVDSLSVAHDVREWAIEAAKNPKMRVCLAGYEGEHVMPNDWDCVAWKAHGGFANIGNAQGKINASRERLWFSPSCLKPSTNMLGEEAK